jgi:hypothetical protein
MAGGFHGWCPVAGGSVKKKEVPRRMNSRPHLTITLISQPDICLYCCLTQLLDQRFIVNHYLEVFLYFYANMHQTWFKKRRHSHTVKHHQEDERRRRQEDGCIAFWNYNSRGKCPLLWCMLVSFKQKRCSHAPSYSVATSLICYQTFSSMTTMIQYVHNDRSL